MKRSRLSYDEWKCIKSKKLKGNQINTEFFKGYIGIIEIEEVSEKQIWTFNGEDIIVCDSGLKWLSILPQNDFYCITAMMDADNDVLLWYIDIIAEQGMDVDGIPYFDDLYLDLVVYPDGTKYMFPEFDGLSRNYKQDEDALYFVDYLPSMNNGWDLDKIKQYSDRVLALCDKMLNTIVDANLRKKYLWLKSHVKESIHHMAQIEELYRKEAEAKFELECNEYNARFSIYKENENM